MGPLDGVKVLELAEFGFVPSCGAVLADWGADVVKVERPSGDPLRAVMGAGLVADTGEFNFLWEQMNRNKRGIAIDLRSIEGRAALDSLIEWADVLITSFLPSARTRLRLDPDDCWAVNPGLVYARGHGQGQRGPDADLGGFDAVSFWARGGIGHMLTPPDGPLVMQRAAMGDGPSGAHLAGGIAAALFRRERTGKGSVVDVALLATAVWTLAPDLVSTTVTGTDPAPLDAGNALPNPLIGSYRTRDGRWLLLNMLDDVRHWEPTCAALGLDALVEHPDYADTELRAAHREQLHSALTDAIASRDLADLRADLSTRDVIWSAMASPVEVIDDPQVVANGYLAAHPDHRRARLAIGPCQFGDELPRVRSAAPEIGEHTDEVLAEVGFSPEAIADLRAADAIV
ncbi:MAG: CoA transferase [Actinobacteria bacterium]|nr:CoA transferase [Actinomycetota bacterium]